MRKTNRSIHFLASDLSYKLLASQVDLVYNQAGVGVAASLFCAVIVFVGLYPTLENNAVFYIWSAVFFLISTLRISLILGYKYQVFSKRRVYLWRDLYVVGALLGGLIWGLSGVLFLSQVSVAQQALMILMMAGVTGGSVPLSSALPGATISFLCFSLCPYIISIALLVHPVYLLFDLTLPLYLIYSITLAIRLSRLIKKSILLRYENDVLLNNLADAKRQLEISNKKLEEAATHDPLTHVANRSLFNEKLKKALSKARRNKLMLAVLYIDIDKFKLANDHYGHAVGDYILLTVIERLKKHLGTDERIGRIGGDELVIFLENIRSKEEIASIANKLCDLFAIPIKYNDIEIKVSSSIGISISPDEGYEAEYLLHRADKAMYAVKDQGGNNFNFSKTSFAT